jgi:sulfite exporter TauE/SafE
VMPLILTVLTASLLGSLHCAGMCGAFVTFAVTGGTADAATQARLHAAYNLGRLVVYVLLGVSAGALGAALDLAGALVGLQRVAAVSAGAIMVAAGILTILRLRGVRLTGLGVPKGFERWLTAGHRFAAKQTPMLRAASIGLLTTLLPCGWLYAFVVTAAGTADPVMGGVTMAVFWVGTLPMLIAVGTLARRAAGALGSKLPTITAVAVIVVGVVTVVDRAGLVQLTPRMLNDATVVNVAGGVAPSSSDLPCCHEHP